MGLNIDKLEAKLLELRNPNGNKQSKPKANKNHKTYEFYQLQTGRNVIQILPAKSKDDEFFLEVPYHQMGKSCGFKQVVCSEQLNGDTCVLCESAKNMSKKEAKSLRVKKKFYLNILVNREVKVLSVGQFIFREILALLLDPDYGESILNGREIVISKSGRGLDTKYTVTARPVFEQFTKDYSDQMADLNIFAKVKSSQDILYLLENGEFPDRSKQP